MILVPEGIYHIVSNYGDANSVVRSDIRVQTAKLTDVTVTHRAAIITLKLVNERGGEALANTQWTVLTPGGDIIKEVIGAFPRVILAEGDYRAIARNDDKIVRALLQGRQRRRRRSRGAGPLKERMASPCVISVTMTVLMSLPSPQINFQTTALLLDAALDAPMVGRGSELDVIERTLDRAIAGPSAELVTIVGTAGVGKSRLVRAFLDCGRPADARVARGRCLFVWRRHHVPVRSPRSSETSPMWVQPLAGTTPWRLTGRAGPTRARGSRSDRQHPRVDRGGVRRRKRWR